MSYNIRLEKYNFHLGIEWYKYNTLYEKIIQFKFQFKAINCLHDIVFSMIFTNEGKHATLIQLAGYLG